MTRGAAMLLLSGLVLAQTPTSPASELPALSAPGTSMPYLFADQAADVQLLLYEDGANRNALLLENERGVSPAGPWGFLFVREPEKSFPDSTLTTTLPTPATEDEGLPPAIASASAPGTLPKVLTTTPTSNYPFSLPNTARTQTRTEANAPTANTVGGVDDPRLRPGALVPARLVTAAVVPAGLGVPVLVEAGSEGCGERASCPLLRYLGEARIMVGGRIEIKLQYAVIKGQSVPVNASAFAQDDIGYGLKGDVIEQAPSLAADLIRGTLGGISDWTTAALQAQNTTIAPSGAVAVEKQTPPLSSFLASRAASLFSLPQDSKALTRVMVVPAGTSLYVYVQEARTDINEAQR